METVFPFIVALAVSTGVLGLGLMGWVVADYFRRSHLRRRYLGHSAEFEQKNSRERWLQQMAAGGERLDRLLKEPGETRMLMAQAGWRDAQARTGFYAFQFLLPVVVGVIALLVITVLGLFDSFIMGVAAIAFVVILAMLLPRYILRSKAKTRREALRKEVPLFINLLVLLFEAGVNLRQALQSLVRDSGDTMPALTDELAPILRQIESGADADELLRETGKLLAIDDLDTVLGILRQVERYGGEIREPLLEVLDTLQTRRAMELREMVNVMSGKMTVVLVACFFPPLLVFIAGPAFMSISQALKGLG